MVEFFVSLLVIVVIARLRVDSMFQPVRVEKKAVNWGKMSARRTV